MREHDGNGSDRVSGDPTREQKSFTMEDLDPSTLITEPARTARN